MRSLKENSVLTKAQYRELCEIRALITWNEEILAGYVKMAKAIREKSNLGARFSTRTFDTFDTDSGDREAFDKCMAYAKCLIVDMQTDKNGLLLTGSTGIGKTHLAAAIANKAIDSGIVTIFSTFSDLLKAERDSMNGGKSMLNKYKDVPLLVIDDLGKEKQSEWVNEVLYQIVNHRYEAMLPIIITTNLTMKELYNTIDHAVFGRLVEMCEVVSVNGKDRRLKKML